MQFLGEDFLLPTVTARALFACAKEQPILDWHCHLSPKEIDQNAQPKNITELWLGGDHYKWRAMRSCGVAERLITGDAPDKDKFFAFAQCMPLLIGNPLYHWTHLELQRYFGIHDVLSNKTAQAIWDMTSRVIAENDFSPCALIERSNVRAVCTTDDPADGLEFHQSIQKKSLPFDVRPAFRPDKALAIAAPDFPQWIGRLETASGVKIASFAALKNALELRIAAFAALGCRACDHGLTVLRYAEATDAELEDIFKQRMTNNALGNPQIAQYQTGLMQFLGAAYAKRGWCMELHIGATRNNNSRRFAALGADAGFDSIGDAPVADALSALLNSLDQKGVLPKTILFNLNPRDNAVFGAMSGNFQTDEARGKLQYGPAWWFSDHIDGMRRQLQTLANLGALGTFIGMTTDSRSFLSYPRHEYFRRILCGLLGDWTEQGLVPDDLPALKKLVCDICFGNAADYFSL
ncbi:MAG: glucuronate isomerase [Oscillospiraceae bacterium]|jgi:glucuronate isomerase|nr:glucuronate isomerase [Oscillospiraceae bacterium]